MVKVIDLGNQTRNVSPAVAIGIFEACWVDLVEDSILPPRCLANPAVWVMVEIGAHLDGLTPKSREGNRREITEYGGQQSWKVKRGEKVIEFLDSPP
jgi:hypothetical protein